MPYPNDGYAHAYKANISTTGTGDKIPQGISTNPVQLTACKTTRLLLNVTRDAYSQNHTISGWLRWRDQSVSNKQVKVKVNETEYLNTTDVNGHFSLNLNLLPKDNETTLYMITAGFEEVSDALNATAWAKTIDGQECPACTTICYGFKPAVNCTVLKVDPRSSEETTPTNSTEDMQKKMEQDNTLKIWLEPGGIIPPWFKLHVRIPSSWFNLTIHGWVGFPWGLDSKTALG